MTLRLLVCLCCILAGSQATADQPPSPAAVAVPTLTFGVVPQQATEVLAQRWVPILDWLGERAGVRIGFRTAPDIPAFEARLAAGQYDLAYMNPYHYTVYQAAPGYQAFAKERDQRLRGILVVRKDSPITDIAQLRGQPIAFPAPAAFAASLLPQAALRQAGVPIEPHFVRSHESVYLAVAKGLYPAGGGIERTFENTAPGTREQLRVLWQTAQFTPHAFAAHPRVDPLLVARIRDAMVAMTDSPPGKALLEALEFKGIAPAADADWNDVRALGLAALAPPAAAAP